jgi:hypothetical protein
MSDRPEDPPERTAQGRGEAAWKAAKADIAARNDAARKAGRAARHATEQRAAAGRKAAERLERADLRRRFGAE